MRCCVYLLGRRGRRLPWREDCNGPSFQGELRTHYLTLKERRYFLATLVSPGDSFCKPLLPDLYEPVLITIVGALLVLRGFERLNDSATVQE